jgi:gliding motility-associated-like protein
LSVLSVEVNFENPLFKLIANYTGKSVLFLLILFFGIQPAFCQQQESGKNVPDSVQSSTKPKIVHASPIFSFDYPDVIPKCYNYPLTLQVQAHPEYYYRWYQDGILTTNITTLFPVLVTAKYRAEISLDNKVWETTKEVQVNVIYLPDPQILVDQPTFCGGSDAILKSNVPLGTDYDLVWIFNGNILHQFTNKLQINVNLPGAYTLNILGKTNSCLKTSSIYRLEFTPAPVYNFVYNDVINACQGTSTVLKADGDVSYQYRWYKDDVLTGATTPSITVTTTGKYKVEVSNCPNTWIPSKEIQVNVPNLPIPVITADKSSYCEGDLPSLSAGITADAAYTITWQRDGSTLTQWQDKAAIIADVPGDYTVIVSSKIVTACIINSTSYKLIINPLPTVTVQQVTTGQLCEGQLRQIKAVHSAGTVLWSTGETGDVISVSATGNYSAVVTSASGCQATSAIDLQFLEVASLADVHDTTFCTYTNAPVTLTAPAGFVKYIWNGQEGGPYFVADRPQTVTLNAINSNGCPTIKQINIISSCPSINIPSAFTPNGDGKNDTWNITGMETDGSVLVKVYSRYGVIVYQSKGTNAAWNGQHNGSNVPPGVYYYVISGKNNQQLFSGSLTLLN